MSSSNSASSSSSSNNNLKPQLATRTFALTTRTRATPMSAPPNSPTFSLPLGGPHHRAKSNREATAKITKMKTSTSRIRTTHLALIAALLVSTSCARSLPLQENEDRTLGQPDASPSFKLPNKTQTSPTHNPFAPRSISYVFDSKQLSPHMQMRKLPPTSNNITCNDGSQVGYYLRQNVHSKSWVIYLQGGGFCGSEESCLQRWQRSPHLMSSNYWPKTKSIEGILSSEPKQNPYLWNANHVYIPYCSSDSWTGLRRQASLSGINNRLHSRDNDNFPGSEGQGQHQSSASTRSLSSLSFMGSRIIERVLDSLYNDFSRESSLYEAKFILLAGESAGATGVILNLDKVKKFVDEKFEADKISCSQMNETTSLNNTADCDSASKQQPVVRGLADSGWFLDNEPYDQGTMMFGDIYLDASGVSSSDYSQQDHIAGAGLSINSNHDDCDRQRCGPLQSIKQAMRFWNGQVPSACAATYPTEPWRCYFGYRAYQSLKTPLFVVQWLYDEAQLLADNIMRPITSGQWDYVNKLVADLRASFENVTALFAPSCFSHSLVTKPTWNQININGLKLPHVLNSWEEQSLTSGSPQESLTAQDYDSSRSSSSSSVSIGDEFSVVSRDATPTFMAQPPSDKQNNISNLPSITNRPTFEALLAEHSDSGLSSSGSFVHMQQDQPAVERTHKQTAQMTSQAQNRPPKSSRKRKRNNNNTSNSHQQKNRQVRQRSNLSGEFISSAATSGGARIHSVSDTQSSSNPMLNLLPLIDKSIASGDLMLGRTARNDRTSASNTAGRLGRSTIVDDATLNLSNNVPDDIITAPTPSLYMGNQFSRDNQPQGYWQSSFNFNNVAMSRPAIVAPATTFSLLSESTSKFRLIDSCGWPQCNRDCPTFNADMVFS